MLMHGPPLTGELSRGEYKRPHLRAFRKPLATLRRQPIDTAVNDIRDLSTPFNLSQMQIEQWLMF
jgi:hypothetical protein